jgi:GTP-binding protein Era
VAHRAGFVTIVGRPNVGKSTLLNALVGAKLAAVSPKPQTTRNRIAGIRTLPEAQIVFLDTPGIHAARSALNRRMVEVAKRTLGEAEVVLLVLDASAGITAPDRELAATVGAMKVPVVVVLNKIDRLPRTALLPILADISRLLPDREVVPASARKGDSLPIVLDVVGKQLPEGPRLFDEDEYTTETERFLAQEIVREQVFLATKEEVPYATAVVVESFETKPERNVIVIGATILVERPNHKGILVGAGGQQLKEIGQRARRELETLLGSRVFLELFVRVEPGWARNSRRLDELGI